MEDKKLKILQINKLYYPVTGGIERVVQQLAEGLNERTDMKVLVCQEKGKTAIEHVNGVEVHRAGSLGVLFSLPISFSFFWQLRKLSKGRDIIHCHMPFPLGDMACLFSGYKGKIVLWWHSDIVRQKKMMHFYKPIMERFLKRADVIIVATEGHIEGSKYLKPYKGKCRIVPFGVEPSIEKKADVWLEKSPETHTNLTNPKEKVRFLFAGRLVYYKGCKVLLEAFKNVQGAELVLIGSGPLEEELRAMVSRYRMEEKVTFLGKVSEKRLSEEFQNCDVFVLPSILRSEAFGLVQIEAMVYGKPVINTNLPSGVPYVSIDGETGLTVEPDNVKELENAMNWFVAHPEQRKTMGEAARKRVKEHYTMQGMLDGTMQVYEEVCRE